MDELGVWVTTKIYHCLVEKLLTLSLGQWATGVAWRGLPTTLWGVFARGSSSSRPFTVC